MALASMMQDLHCSGFRHGQLGAGIESHLLCDPRRNQPVIIDFKNAELTPCKHKLPLAIMEAKPLSWMLCGELVEVGFYLKLWGDKKCTNSKYNLNCAGVIVFSVKEDPIAHKLFHDFRSHKRAESGTLAAPTRYNHADSSPSL